MGFLQVLVLLAKIARKEVKEEVTYTPQESGKQRFKCGKCEGDGYVECWEGGTKTRLEDKEITDCNICKGQGFVELRVIDKRKKSKKKDLYYNTVY